MLLRYILLLCLGLILGGLRERGASAAVISIDFSSEWLKIALVKVSASCIKVITIIDVLL